MLPEAQLHSDHVPTHHPKKCAEDPREWVRLTQKALLSRGDVILRRGWNLLSRIYGIIQPWDLALETL